MSPRDSVTPGLVVHTMGYPLKSDAFGGGWVYGMGESDRMARISCRSAWSSGSTTATRRSIRTASSSATSSTLKIRPFLAGGKMIDYGAKSSPEGGLYSMPRLYGDGFLIVGDAAGIMNSMRLKGIHLAIRSGMLAAQTVFEALKAGDSLGEPRPRPTTTAFRRRLDRTAANCGSAATSTRASRRGVCAASASARCSTRSAAGGGCPVPRPPRGQGRARAHAHAGRLLTAASQAPSHRRSWPKTAR